MKLAVCAMVKNEERDIEEWILYHAWTGWDAVIVFDNASSDQTSEAIMRTSKLADVRSFYTEAPFVPGQSQAYLKCARDFADEFDWVAFVDGDEFFVPVTDVSPAAYLSKMDSHAAVGVNWVTYGSSGYISRPEGLVAESFIDRAPFGFSMNRFVKTIARPKEIVSVVNSHAMEMRGEAGMVDALGSPIRWAKVGKTVSPVGHDVARFNHYYTRSAEQWDLKMGLEIAPGKPKRGHENFDRINKETVRDTTLPDRYPDVLKRIRDTLGRPS